MKRKTKLGPIHSAVRNLNVDELLNAIENGGDIEELDVEGRTALSYAVQSGSLDMVCRLIAAGANVNSRDTSGWAPLHFAAQNYDLPIASKLIEEGANINHQDTDGNTALSRAVFASNGRSGLIERLVEAGADYELPNNYGISPLSLAKTIANYDVLSVFRNIGINT